MTKLLEWVGVLVGLSTLWINLYVHQKDIAFIKDNPNLLLYAPFLLVLLFGLYAASVVLYRVFTFNNCEQAAKELRKEIEQARADLTKRGYKFKVKSS